MPKDTAGALGILVLLGVVAFVIYLYVSRSKLLLQRWAEENGYEVLCAEYRAFRKGPYRWSGRGQAVYRVEVRDERGNQRKVWVRCGGWWAGVLGDKVEARFDE